MESGAADQDRDRDRDRDREERRHERAEIDGGDVVPAQREDSRHGRKTRRGGDEIPAASRTIAAIATRQQGAITHRQLLAAGLRHSAIGRRVANGDLHRVHYGVYLVGHVAHAPLAREWAALLACGERAVISHESAARVWSMITAESPEVHVIMRGCRNRTRPGLRIHRGGDLDVADIRRRQGLAVTSPARALVDLAAAQSPQLEHAFIEAHARRLVKAAELVKAMERVGSKPGARSLRALIAANESGFTRSEAERRLRRLLRAARLPEPKTNVPLLGRYTVDCLWPEHRLIAEFDGYPFHGHRPAFERDRARDAALVAAGYRVMRITWLQLTREPYAVVANVAAALARGPGPAPG